LLIKRIACALLKYIDLFYTFYNISTSYINSSDPQGEGLVALAKVNQVDIPEIWTLGVY
jgi:hypothetical protein